MEKLEKVKQLVASIEADTGKFYNQNNGTAGTRVGKGMQDLKVLVGEIRKQITDKKNAK